MKHTVKRLLSLLLVLIFSLGLYPTAALAEPEGEIAPVEDSAEPGEDCVLDVQSDGSGSISMVPPPAEQQDTLPSGTCGDRLSWIFDEASGVLTISGDGAMQDYTWSTSGTTAPWYSYRSQIVTVVLPDGITSVGNNAFRNCSALTQINLPEGITSIGASSFAFCRQLSAVSIPGSAESLGGSAFYECSGLTSVELRPGLAEIGDSAFHKCTALTEISLPASVMRIQSKAFNGCSALTQISFLGHAPTIAGDAFTGVSAVARYPGASGSWNSDTLQNYGGTLSWEPYYEKYELYILGTQLDEMHLSGLLDNTLAYSFDPGENVLSLQGSYTVTAEDPDSLIRSGIDGLTIRMDNTVRLYAPADKDLTFLELNADTTLTSASGAYQLQINGNTGLTTGAQVADGVRLTLEDANLFFSGLTYGLVGGSGSKLDLIRSTGEIRGSWGAVRSFSGGISMQNCEITVPEAYTIGSDSSICGSNGTSAATRVCFEPSYGLVIDGVPVTEDNRSDVLDNGIFSFDGVHTLTVSGDYTGTADVLIDSNLYSLVVNVPGTAVLTNSSSASETALIRSSGDLFLSGGGYLSLKHAENAGDDSCGVLLIGANEATLSVQQCMLNVSNVARGFATSNVGQSLRLYKAEVKISSFDTAVSGFTGGVTLTDCAYVTPAYAGEKNGTVIIDSIWGDAPCVNLEITGKTVYDLIVDNTRVYADNLDDIRGAGVFSFDPGTNTLHVSGVYDPETIWSGWAINKFRPVIDSSIDGLIIRVDGDTVLTSYLENYNSFTPIINSTKRFTIRGASELDTPVLKLTASSSSIAADGIHSTGGLTLENVKLITGEYGNVPRYGILGDGGTLTLQNAAAWIATENSGAAVTGFDAITLEDCMIVSNGVSISGGSLVCSDGLAQGVIISNKYYNIYIDGYQLYDDRLEMNFGTIVYDPDSNTLYLNGFGEAPVASASLPYIENHIPGLTIYVENAIKLPTTSETTGRGIIETDVDMTIRSNNCYLALEGNGGSTVGILVKNGATLTLDGARLNILSVGRGIVGEGGAKLNIRQSWVHVRQAGLSGISGFGGGLTLNESTLHTPADGVVQSGAVYESDGVTLAKTVEFFGSVYELNINGTWVTYTNKSDVLGDGTFSYDPESNTLTVSKSFTSNTRATMISNQIDGLTIAVSGDVTLTNSYDDIITYVIYSTADLTVTGGNLTLLGNGLSESYGIRLSGDDANLTLKDSKVVIEDVAYGLAGRTTGQKLTVNNATVKVTAAEEGVSRFDGGIELTGSVVSEPENYTVNSDGTICDSFGSGAGYVEIEPGFAAYQLWLGETQVTERNKDDILGDGTASYDPETKTLTFTGELEITEAYGTYGNIYADGMDLNLVVNGDLNLSAADFGILVLHGALIIGGTGRLAVNSNKWGIYAYGGVTVNGATVTSNAGSSDNAYHALGAAGGDININGGTITLSGPHGIWVQGSGNSIRITGGFVTADGSVDAVYWSDGTFTLGTAMQITSPVGAAIGANSIMNGSSPAKHVVIEPTVSYDLWVCGTQVTTLNKADILGNGKVSFDPATNTLTLNNANLTSTTVTSATVHNGVWSVVYASTPLTIAGNGSIYMENTTSIGRAVIDVDSAVTFDGDISISIVNPYTGWTSYAVNANVVTVAGGSVSVTAKGGTGISGGTFNMTGGELTATCESFTRSGTLFMGIGSETYGARISGGKATFNCGSYGMIVRSTLNMTGGELNIEKGGLTSYGADVTFSSGTATLSGLYSNSGTWKLTVENDARLSVNSSVKVPGGIVIGDGLAITTPAGGKIVQITPESGDPYYTVTEADGATVAKHVVIEPLVAYPLWLGETQVTTLNKADILGDGTASFDPETNTLTFTTETPNITGLHENALINSAENLNIIGPSSGLTLEREGSYSSDDYTIYSGGDLVIYGDLNAASGGIYAHNITVEGNVKVKSAGRGLEAQDGTSNIIKVTGDVEINAINEAICAGLVEIGGELTATTSNGYRSVIFSSYDVTIGGNCTLVNTSLSSSDNYAISSYGNLVISGDLDASASAGINARSITVNGNVKVKSALGTGMEAQQDGTNFIKVTGDVEIEAALGSIYCNGVIEIGGKLTATTTTRTWKVIYATGDITIGGDSTLVSTAQNSSDDYAIYSGGNLVISGDLDTSASAGIYACSIMVDGNVKVNSTVGGGMKVLGGTNIIKVTGDVEINAILGSIECYGNVEIEGKLTATTILPASSMKAIYATGSVTVGGDTMVVKKGDGYGIYAKDTITVGSGMWDVTAGTEALYAANGITIPDTHAITTPTGGKIVQMESHYTVTEADGATEASHVIIQPAVGDINRDGEVNALDLMLLRKYLVGLPIEGTFDQTAADLNGDNVIDILDLVRLRKVLA